MEDLDFSLYKWKRAWYEGQAELIAKMKVFLENETKELDKKFKKNEEGYAKGEKE